MTIYCKWRSPSASVVWKVGWMMVTCWPPMCSPWTSQWHPFIPIRCFRRVWGVELRRKGHGAGMPPPPILVSLWLCMLVHGCLPLSNLPP